MKPKAPAKPKFIEVTQRNAKTGQLVTYRRIRSSGVIPGRETKAGKVEQPTGTRWERSMARTHQLVARGFAAFCERNGLNPNLPW